MDKNVLSIPSSLHMDNNDDVSYNNNTLDIYNSRIDKYDSKRQFEIKELLESKEKMILEKSSQHKAILDDYQLLREDYIIKETEVERLNRQLTEMRSAMADDRQKMKAKHEEMINKIKVYEEMIKDISSFISSSSKYCVEAFSQCLGAMRSVAESSVSASDRFVQIEEDIDSSFERVLYHINNRPKRILVYLDHIKQAYNMMKDKVSATQVSDAYEDLVSFVAHTTSNRLSIRRNNISSGETVPNLYKQYIDMNGIDMSEFLRHTFEMYSELNGAINGIDSSNVRSVDNRICHMIYEYVHRISDKISSLYKFNNHLPSDAPAQRDDSSNMISLSDPSLGAILRSVSSRLQEDRDKMKGVLSSDTQSLQHDIQTYIESNTGIEEEVYALMQQNQAAKDRLSVELMKGERLKKRLSLLVQEKEKLAHEMSDIEHDLSNIESMIDEEERQYEETLSRSQRLNIDVQSKRSYLSRVKQRKEEEKDRMKEVRDIIDVHPHDHAEGIYIDIDDSHTNGMVEAIISLLRETYSHIISSSYTDEVYRRTMNEIDDINTRVKDMRRKIEDNDQEANRKRQILNNMIVEENSVKDNYIRTELKVEITQQRIIQVQQEINRLHIMMDEAKRESDQKKKELLVKAENLTKVERKASIEMTEFRKHYDDSSSGRKKAPTSAIKKSTLSEPLIYDNEDNVYVQKAIDNPLITTINISYLHLWLATSCPVLLLWVLYKLSIL